MATWFIADLHLSPARPDITSLFMRFLHEQAQGAEALYILGDLFDAWIGDDDTSEFVQSVQTELAKFTATGVPVFFIAGNRDFLIGSQFSQRTGITLLPETCVIDLYGTPTLVLHGDTLCTDDHKYQRFRRIIRHPWLTKLLLALPLSTRMKIAAKLRASSKTQQPLTEQELRIMDVNDQTVVQTFEQHQVKQMIHGHTHRPNEHHHKLSDGSQALRIVLGDWYEQGSWLEVTATGHQLVQAHRYET